MKGNNLLYIDSETRRLIRQQDYLKKSNQTGSKHLSQAFQQVKHKVQYRIRNLRTSYYRDKVEENMTDIKGTWKILKQAINKDSNRSNVEMLKVNDQKVKEKYEIAKLFNEQLCFD